jgi:4-alpha-glucanotransferase
VHPVHNSRDPFYRFPPGARRCAERLLLRLSVAHNPQPDAVRVRVWSNREVWISMRPLGLRGGSWLYETELTLPDEPCLVWYDFRICAGDCEISYGNAQDRLGGEGAVWAELPPSFQITVYDPAFEPPKWMRRAAVYQIFPDRFRRTTPAALPDGRALHENWYDPPAIRDDPDNGDYVSDDFFGGTLEGIREKLPYIAGLGVTAIYLNPIFYADSSHRYDTNDYMLIDPTLGNESKFVSLCDAARKLGIRIILDGVFSHTGINSVYFRSARFSRASPYLGWYRFMNWPDSYGCWWGVRSLPETVETNPAFMDFMLRDPDAVVPYWLKAGAGGWRLDVADELPIEFLRAARESVKRADPLAALIGEVWENASCKVTYGEMRSYCLGDTLDSVMNYPLRSSLLAFLTRAVPARQTAREMLNLIELYPKQFSYSLMNLMGSHDRPRALNALVGVTGDGLTREQQANLRLTREQRITAEARLRLMWSILCAWPGMPTIYYGDETGLEGANDPFCRGTYPWGKEDEELIGFFRAALASRARCEALTVGEVDLITPSDDTLLIIRSITNSMDALGDPAPNSFAMLAVNRSDAAVAVRLPAETFQGKTLLAEYGAASLAADGEGYAFILEAVSAMLWTWRE